MPSRIEELIAEFRKNAGHPRAEREFTFKYCADELERAYREEVVPLVDALQDIRDYWNGHKNERAMGDALDHIVDVSEDALHRFDAPAGTDPKPTAEEKERYCPKHSPKGIVCDCDLAAEEPKQ